MYRVRVLQSEPFEMKMNLFQNAVFPLWMHQLHEDVLTFSVETLLFFNDPVHGYWRCWGMCALTCPWSKCGLVLPSAGLNRYRRSLELRHTLAGVDPDGFCHTHIRAFEPILAEVDAIKVGGLMLPGDFLRETFYPPSCCWKSPFLFPQESQDYEPEA